MNEQALLMTNHAMKEPELPRESDSLWLEIHDEVITSAELAEEIERRVTRRRIELGVVNVDFPTFDHVSAYPEPVDDPPNPYLYYYLKQANRTPPTIVEPILAPSPATQTPVLGALWGRIRGEMHNLVLFYVNRSVSDQNRLNVNLISALNEMTRVIQDQQARIEALQAEVRRLTGEAEQA